MTEVLFFELLLFPLGRMFKYFILLLKINNIFHDSFFLTTQAFGLSPRFIVGQQYDGCKPTNKMQFHHHYPHLNKDFSQPIICIKLCLNTKNSKEKQNEVQNYEEVYRGNVTCYLLNNYYND